MHRPVPRLARPARLAAAVVFMVLAACADHPALESRPPELQPLAALRCVANVRAESLQCQPVDPTLGGGAVGDLIVGWQGVYVRMISASPSYNAGTGIFSADVSVQNLLGQPLGTTDGITPDPDGIR